jgi:hypothetical protein
MVGNDTRVRQYRRDLAVGRVRKMSGLLTAGALVFTGLLSAAVAHALPGRSPTAHAGSSQSPATVPANPGSSGPSAGNLQPPGQAPVTAPPVTAPAYQAPAPVVSGGS